MTGGTHSAKERYGASDARFLQYVHPQNLGLSEDFAYLSAALELANTFGTSVVPKKRWSHLMTLVLRFRRVIYVYIYIIYIYIYRDSILEVFPDPVTTTLQG